MLLRIQAETLRLTLAQASATLESLPILSKELETARETLRKTGQNATQLARSLGDLVNAAVNGERLAYNELKGPREQAEIIAGQLRDMYQGLQEIENNSFIVQVGSGKDIAVEIGVVAANLIESVQAIEQDIDDSASFSAAWQKLGAAREEANGKVFSESIELLGGIALRDARLDANICELADTLIATLYRSSTQPARAIPGGVATIIMTSDRVIRLPFPQWTIWALPLTAHELYNIVLKREFGRRREIGQVTEDVAALLDITAAERCLADVFATYTLGPAYAYAAITLLLDPTRPEDDARVEAILTTLAALMPGKDPGPGISYVSEANRLRAEWEAARLQAFAAAGLRAEKMEAHLRALGDLDPHPNTAEGLDYLASIEKLRGSWQTAWRAATANAGATAATAETRIRIEKLASAACRLLTIKEFPKFSLGEWLPLQERAKQLLAKNCYDIEPTGLDLRRALNLVWLARLDPTRPAEQDLTAPAMALATKIMDLARKNKTPSRATSGGPVPMGA